MNYLRKVAATFGTDQQKQVSSPAASYGTIKPSQVSSTGHEDPQPSYSGQGVVQSLLEAERRYIAADTADYDEDDDDDFSITGSYKSFLLSYTCVPLSSILVLLVLVILPAIAWPRTVHKSHYTDLFAAAGAWIVSFAFRMPIHILTTLFERYDNAFTGALCIIIQTATQECLRLGAFILVRISLEYDIAHPEWIPYPDADDEAFRRVWWMAIGWAAVESIVAISQSYSQLALYKDILEEDPDLQEEQEEQSRGRDVDLDEEVQHLISIKNREELEDVYGIPFPAIPTFISCLQRIDSILLSFALMLLLSSAFLRSVVATASPHHPHPIPDFSKATLRTLPALIGIIVIHSGLVLMWTMALPRIGVHTASYTALLIALILFFGGLASWGTLD